MRILIINYRYFVSGGPERYMFNVIDELESRGHETIPFSIRYSRNVDTSWARYFVEPIAGEDEVRFSEHGRSLSALTRGLARLYYSREVYEALTALIRDTQPDVAYVLHYLRKLSPSVLKALADAGVPSLVRLSDFQMVCPASDLMRDGHECRECVGRSVWPSVRYRCVKGSRALSLLNYAAISWQRSRGFFDIPAAYVCPSALMSRTLADAGIRDGRRIEISTFVKSVDSSFSEPISSRPRIVSYVGRIDPGKGVDVLLDAFTQFSKVYREPDAYELHIAGDSSGDYAQGLMRRHPAPAIKWLGMLDRDEVTRLLARSRVSVIPSLWPENLPNSLLESWAVGTPVIASRIGSLADIVTEGETGFLFEVGASEDLHRCMQVALGEGNLERMSSACAQMARERYSPEVHTETLLTLFTDLAQGRGQVS